MSTANTPVPLSPATDWAVARLTRAHVVEHDDHSVDWPALIDWIADAVTSKVKRGGAASGDGDAGINEGALRIFEAIRVGTQNMRTWLVLPARDRGLKADLAEAWEVAQWSRRNARIDNEAWDRICNQLSDWVKQIEREWEDRPSRMEVTVPCPSCGNRWILEPAPEGDKAAEDKRRSAVVVEYTGGRDPVALCQADGCGGRWEGWQEVATLGRTLGASQDLEVLAACGIPLVIDS